MGYVNVTANRRRRSRRASIGGEGIGGGGGGGGIPGPLNLLTSGSNGSAGATQDTASITPTANALVLVALGCRTGTAPGVAGNGGSYTLVGSQLAASGFYLHVYQRTAAAPSAGVITITTPSADVIWSVFEIVDGLVVQSKFGAPGGTSPALTFNSAFLLATNYTIGCCASDNDASNKEAAHTQIHQSNYVSACGGALNTAYKTIEDATVTFVAQFATTNHALGILEIGHQ